MQIWSRWIKFFLLQFHLLPIRDWNIEKGAAVFNLEDCNFTYSLLGIETMKPSSRPLASKDCNFTYSLLGIETWALNGGQ